MKNKIVQIICMIATIAIEFVCLYAKKMITLQSLPYALSFFICSTIISYLILEIGFNMLCNSDSVLFRKYKIYKFFYMLEKANELEGFEKFCIQKQNIYFYAGIAEFIENLKYEEIIEKVKNKDYNSIITHAKAKNKKANKLLLKHLSKWNDSFDIPYYGEIFIQYHNKTLLNKKQSLFQALFGFVSFIVSVVSLIGLNGFLKVDVIVYLVFFMPMVFLIIEILFTFKKDKERICNIYQNSYSELNKFYSEYKNNN